MTQTFALENRFAGLAEHCLKVAGRDTDRALGVQCCSQPIGLDLVSVETMTELLQQERLGVRNESDVWDGVLRWIRFVPTRLLHQSVVLQRV